MHVDIPSCKSPVVVKITTEDQQEPLITIVTHSKPAFYRYC
jgi:hypothetical protein